MYRIRFIFSFKTAFFLFTSFVLLLPTITFADAPTDPCTDPFNDCGAPLDTYVWILAIIAGVFAMVYLYRQQKERLNA